MDNTSSSRLPEHRSIDSSENMLLDTQDALAEINRIAIQLKTLATSAPQNGNNPAMVSLTASYLLYVGNTVQKLIEIVQQSPKFTAQRSEQLKNSKTTSSSM